MASIWRDAKHNELVERLANRECKETGEKIFRRYADLMLFAGAVGYYFERFEPVQTKAFEIRDTVFSSENEEGFIFLVALLRSKDVNIYRDENESACWEIFEGYANGGLDVISTWLDDNATDVDGIDTLLVKIKEKVAEAAPGFEEEPDLVL